jgi:hypothetical protein
MYTQSGDWGKINKNCLKYFIKLQPEFSIARLFLFEEFFLPLFRALNFGLNCQPFYPAVLKEVVKNNGKILKNFSFYTLK